MKHFYIIGLFLLSFAQAFSDLQAATYPEAIRYLAQRGILSGYPDQTFRPGQLVTRAEFAVTIMRFQPATEVSQPCFGDVPADAWYADAVCQSQALGLITGFSDGSFRPQQPLRYAEGLAVLMRIAGISVTVSGSNWFEPYIYTASQLGWYKAREPLESMTRGALAELLFAWLATEAQTSGAVIPSSGCSAMTSAQDAFYWGQNRVIVAAPQPAEAQKPLRLIFAFHGRTSPNHQVQQYYGLEPVLGQEAIIVYPAARQLSSGFSWTDATGRNDYQAFDRLLDELAAAYCIDLSTVTVVGHSLGGYFASDIACKRGDRVQAVVSLGGGITESDCVGRVAALILHNPRDNLVGFNEGERVQRLFIHHNGLSSLTAVPVDPALDCVKYAQVASPAVWWCPHSQDYTRGGRYYPHQWPSETASVIASFLRSL